MKKTTKQTDSTVQYDGARSVGHPSGVGEWTLRNARWVNGPATMRQADVREDFYSELAKYDGTEGEDE